jgi:hypothetical protein
MLRLVGPLITCSLAIASTSAIAQAGATPPSASGEESAQRIEGRKQPPSAPSVASELCPTLEQAAAENGLPLDFFVRVIWQESRFNALAVSPKGAQGIAQFMPRTADWRGLSNPFDVNAALKASASYLRDLLTALVILGSRLRPTTPVRNGFRIGSRRAAVYPRKRATMSRLLPAIPPRNGRVGQLKRTERSPNGCRARMWLNLSVIERRRG